VNNLFPIGAKNGVFPYVPRKFWKLGFSSLKLHVNCSPAAFVPCAPSYCLHYSLDIFNAIIITLCCAAIQAFRVRGLDIVTGNLWGP